MSDTQRTGADARIITGLGVVVVVTLFGLGLFFVFGDALRPPFASAAPSAVSQ